MARRSRNDKAGAWHHLMNRGAKREAIFLDDGDRLFYLELLSRIEERFGLEIHAYCLMGNHYHLLARSRKPQMSDAMHWLGLRYAKHFNWRHGFDGSPFRGRFHQVAVASDEHLLAVGRYIHRNPLDLGVERLASYRWSSMADYLGGRHHQKWLHVDTLLRLSGGVDRYEQFVQAENERADLVVRRDGNVEADLRGLRLVTPTERIELTDLDRLIQAALTERERGVLLRREVGATQMSRYVGLVVAADVYRYASTDLAQHYGLASAASARAALSRARTKLAADPAGQDLMEQLLLIDPANPTE